MFTFINAGVIFAFGLVIAGIVGLGMLEAKDFAEREKRVVDGEIRRRGRWSTARSGNCGPRATKPGCRPRNWPRPRITSVISGIGTPRSLKIGTNCGTT